MKGVPASQVPLDVVQPLVDKVLGAPEEVLLEVSEVFDFSITERKPSFDSFVCEQCGEMVVEDYGRLKHGKKVCIPCSGYGR
jgi:formylmethanofuran dehydrogenase subunit E